MLFFRLLKLDVLKSEQAIIRFRMKLPTENHGTSVLTNRASLKASGVYKPVEFTNRLSFPAVSVTPQAIGQQSHLHQSLRPAQQMSGQFDAVVPVPPRRRYLPSSHAIDLPTMPLLCSPRRSAGKLADLAPIEPKVPPTSVPRTPSVATSEPHPRHTP